MKEKSFEGLSISSQLSKFNTTERDYYPDKLIHQLFEEQVARSPEQVAIVCENQQLTYAELNIRANQLAHHLQALGLGTVVGLSPGFITTSKKSGLKLLLEE